MPALRTAPLAGLLLIAGCAGHRLGPGPAGIPYLCADGRIARITYEGGGYFPRAHARLSYDGREIALAAVPPAFGLRYVSEAEPVLIWSARGEEAWLSEPGTGGGEEREIAHCTRVR
jgi:membrane-bound inhibitor of C-type lysozyme